MKNSQRMLACLVLCVIILAASCGRIGLYQNLTEEEANEIMVLLAENNVKAHKKKVALQNEVSYSVEVREADMVKARSLLLKHSLPRRKELGLTGVYKDKGLIPTPDEQKARYLLALKGEIINSLEKIPQVVDADAVLNIPTQDEFASADKQKFQRPTASVVVRVRPDDNTAEVITEAKIQQFVANAVEGLNPRDVTVMISYVPADERMLKPGDVKTIPSPTAPAAGPVAPALGAPGATRELIGLKLDEGSKGKLKIYLLIFFLVLVLLSATLIVVIIQGSRMRRQLAAMRGSAGEHPAIEGQVMDEGPPRLGSGGGEA